MMKNKFLPIICLFFLLTSCSGMNDIIEDYLDRGEINYIGCPDSLSTVGGKERMQLRWLVGKDPRVEGFVIYWNNRQDSIVGKIEHSKLEKGRYCYSVFNIKEGSYEFEVMQVGTKGFPSVKATVTGTSYGAYYISQLKKRDIQEIKSDPAGAKILWGIANGSKYVDFTYEKSDGSKETCRVSSKENETILLNPKPSGTYSYSTYHVPGNDSLDVFKSPLVIDGTFPF